MSLRELPEAKTFPRPKNYQWEAPADVLESWAASPLAASAEENTISIFDVIGDDYMGGGVTAKRIAGALRVIGDAAVTVKINSPGGDLFEGIAIYNLLRAHKAKVTIEVLGIAASAASIIAMAGDEIVMGLGTFIMIHNAWGVVIGNRHDMQEVSDLFAGFDAAITDIYEARTSLKRANIEALMDAESYMGPKDAVSYGFADRVSEDLTAPASKAANDSEIKAKRRIDALLAKEGLPRSERKRLMNDLTGMRGAADQKHGMPGAADLTNGMPGAADFAAHVRQLIETIKS